MLTEVRDLGQLGQTGEADPSCPRRPEASIRPQAGNGLAGQAPKRLRVGQELLAPCFAPREQFGALPAQVLLVLAQLCRLG